MRTAHLPLLFTAACVMFPCAAGAQKAGAVVWAFTRKPGQVLRYRVEQTISGELPDGNTLTAETSAVTRSEVKDVAANGDATLIETTESRKRTVNGHELKEDPATYSVVTRVETRNGTLVKQTSDKDPTPDALSRLGAMLNQTPAPTAPQAVGDTWDSSLDNLLIPGSKVNFHSQFVGHEKAGGIDTLRIGFRMEIPPTKTAETDMSTILVVGFYNVDTAAGRIVRANYNIDNVELPLKSGSIKARSTATITLLPEAAPKTP